MQFSTTRRSQSCHCECKRLQHPPHLRDTMVQAFCGIGRGTVARRHACGGVRGVSCIARAEPAELDPDNASILVAGGAGVAMHATRKLKDMGAWVWMLQRSDKNREEIEKMMAFCSKGDALDKASLDKVFDGIDELDAVVSTIGGTVQDPTADSEGNINLINAAMARGVKKFVLVTSIGTGNSKDAPGPEVYKVLEPVLLEKEKAEAALMEQDKMDWVIIRPGGLTMDDKTGRGFLTEEVGVCGAIARQDVAELVAKALFSTKASKKVLAALDADRVTTSVPYTPFEC
eukprot:TRINITY_DN29379_c0_g1_i3.p2 TRINITY_DN29379_c0_g1~~TRINITY_DN29379_c0_g1_i3.p2  ORF type:complete len:288 (+),score=44.61 TRINITY_DN29379_c0_g1_i3:42-905(+)